MLNKLSHSSDDWNLFCKVMGTYHLAASGFYDDRKSTFEFALLLNFLIFYSCLLYKKNCAEK